MLAVTSNGVGKQVSYRRIKEDWALSQDEVLHRDDAIIESLSYPVMSSDGTIVEGGKPTKDPSIVEQIIEAIGQRELDAAKQRIINKR